ncbi:MAG: CBS domain-containing protein, partial [Crenarchaeota archaeon]|nr:CBS domain-containing protein [Thermoproteota archaeon]
MSCLKSLAFLEAKEIIETDYATVLSSETVSKTISLFSSSEIYEALVMNSEIAGIVTVRDTLKVLNPERTSISRIMFKPPNIQVEAPIYDIAEALISNRIRILPVLEGGSIKGVVKQKAILNKM